MGLFSAFSTKKSDKPMPYNNSTVAARYEEWCENLSTDEVRRGLLVSLTKGSKELVVDVEPKEIEHFDTIVAGFDTAHDGQLQMRSIVDHIVNSYDEQTNPIGLNIPILEALITSHASFPFSSPVSITKDSLCRALLLLTNRCTSNFAQAMSRGGQRTMRARSEQQRLEFIHSSLANPPTGLPTQEDVVDVISRLEYPRKLAPKKIVLYRPISDFATLAQRLEPLRDDSSPSVLPASTLKSLDSLVAATSSREGDVVPDTSFDTSKEVDNEYFVQWATKVQLLQIFDQVFSVFFRHV